MGSATSSVIAALDAELDKLSAAEDFFRHLNVPYAPEVVHVYRLHILKRFNQYLKTSKDLGDLDAVALRIRYAELLAKAYQDFVESTAQEQKVFKVFQDQDGKSVKLESLRTTLPSRH